MFHRSVEWAALCLLVSCPVFAQNVPAAPPAPAPGNLPPPAAPANQESLESKLGAARAPAGLTADEVARRALLRNPDLILKQRSVEAAIASADATRADYLPQLQLQARYTRYSHIEAVPIPGLGAGFPVYLNSYALQASLGVALSDYVLTLSRRMASANHNKTAAKFDELATRLAIARDARVYYYQWIRAQASSLVAQQALEAAEGHAFDARNAFDAGLVPRADVLRTISQQKSAQLSLARANNNVATAAEQLRVIMNDAPQANYAVGENILSELPPFALPTGVGAGFGEALERRLEMRQLGESKAALEEEASAVRAQDFPRLEAQVNGYYSRPNSRYQPAVDEWRATWDATVALSWSPTGIFGYEAQARNADARAEEVAAQRAALKNSLRLEVTRALNAYAEATLGLQTSREGLVAAEENHRVRRELYRAGKATIVEVVDAETELTQARLDVINTHVDLRVAQVNLHHALGRDVATVSR